MEKQIAFDGIKLTPYQDTCKDGEMAVLHNLEMHEGALRPCIINGTEIDLPGEIVFVHKTYEYIHYIYKCNGGLAWVDGDDMSKTGTIDGTYGDNLQITPNGNMLVMIDGGEPKYNLWIGGGYKYEGGTPEVEVEFKLTDTKFYIGVDRVANETQATYEAKKTNITTGINKALDKGFVFPFIARAALELYDGSEIYCTDPVLLCPNIERIVGVSYQSIAYIFRYLYLMFYSQLNVKINGLLADSSLVKYVNIYVTDQSFNVGDVTLCEKTGAANDYNYHKVKTYSQYTGDDYENAGLTDTSVNGYGLLTMHNSGSEIAPLSAAMSCENVTICRSWVDAALRDQLNDSYVDVRDCVDGIENKTMYLWKRIPVSDIDNANEIEPCQTIKNITTSQAAPEDNNIGNTYARNAFVYNGRTFLYNARKEYLNGYNAKNGQYKITDKLDYDVVIKIEKDGGVKYISGGKISSQNLDYMRYIYVPHENATEVIFLNYGIGHKKVTLSESSFLPGKVWINMKGEKGNETVIAGAPSYVILSNTEENDPKNYIYTSKPNNPFVFSRLGENVVSNGEVIKVAAQTKPLSEGQAGDAPLVALCSDGIYAMTVINDGTENTGLIGGTFPIVPDVCTNSDSVLGMEEGILFMTERGLVMLQGNTIQPMMPQLDGAEDPALSQLEVYADVKRGEPMRTGIIGVKKRYVLIFQGYEAISEGENQDTEYTYTAEEGGKYRIDIDITRAKQGQVSVGIVNKYVDGTATNHIYYTDDIFVVDDNDVHKTFTFTTADGGKNKIIISVELACDIYLEYRIYKIVRGGGEGEGDEGDDETGGETGGDAGGGDTEDTDPMDKNDFWKLYPREAQLYAIPVWDYLNKRLLVIPEGCNACFVIKDGVVSTADMPKGSNGVPRYVRRVMNLWPTPYIQFEDNKLMALDKYYEWDGEGTNEGRMVTRPMKLDDLGMKKLSEFALKGDYSGKQTLSLWGSNDLKTWYRIGDTTAKRVPHVPGRYYRYWRVFIDTKLKNSENISGLVVRYDVRTDGRVR